jgi:hypothetical protein
VVALFRRFAPAAASGSTTSTPMAQRSSRRIRTFTSVERHFNHNLTSLMWLRPLDHKSDHAWDHACLPRIVRLRGRNQSSTRGK